MNQGSRSGDGPTGTPPEREPLTDDEVGFLLSMLDLARDGRADELGAAVTAGLPVNLTSAAGDSLLLLAAYHDHPDTVDVLLAAGADPDRVNDRGQTALGAAVFRQSARSVRALLDAGARPDVGGRSATDIAAYFGLSAMSDLLDAARPIIDDAAQPAVTTPDYPASTGPAMRPERPERPA